MVDETNDDIPRPNAADLARRLMESARQEPSLLGRSRPGIDPDFDPNSADVFLRGPIGLPVPVSGGSSIALYEQCEHLASVAVAAAQDAEDAFQRARNAFHSAQRAMLLCGALGLVGLAIGLATVIGTRATSDTATAQLASDPPPYQSASGMSALQPTALTKSSGGLPALDAVYVPPLPAPTGMIKRPPHVASEPVARTPAPPMVTYASSAPWPSSRPLVYRPPYERQRLVYPPFFVALRHDIGMILRGR